jgi:glycosyltransferase involved in cell wall biosynthesis
VIVGPGNGRDLEELRSLEYASRGSIQILGPRDDIPQLLAAADLAIQPGKLSESFGLAAVEAILMGKPLLAFRVGALPYVLGIHYEGLCENYEKNEMIAKWVQLARGTPICQVNDLRRSIIEQFGSKSWCRDILDIVG